MPDKHRSDAADRKPAGRDITRRPRAGHRAGLSALIKAPPGPSARRLRVMWERCRGSSGGADPNRGRGKRLLVE